MHQTGFSARNPADGTGFDLGVIISDTFLQLYLRLNVLFYLFDLGPQHGGAGVDHKHHVLGDCGQVFGGKVVDEVSV